MIDGDSDTPGIDVVRVAEAPRPLLVRVATGEDRCVESVERSTEGVLLHPGTDKFVPRTGRGMEGEQRSAVAEVDLHRRREASVEVQQLLRELRLRPLRALDLLVRDRFHSRIEREQEIVRIAHDRRPAELAQAFETLRRMRSALSVVAEADAGVDVLACEVVQHCSEGNPVAVDV